MGAGLQVSKVELGRDRRGTAAQAITPALPVLAWGTTLSYIAASRARLRRDCPYRLLEMCWNAKTSDRQLRRKPLILLVGAHGLEPWTR